MQLLNEAELRSNRRALLGILLFVILAAVAAGIGLVGRIVDDDGGRPRRDAVSTLDDTGSKQDDQDTNTIGGLFAVAGVGLAAGACVAAPFLVVRHRRRVSQESERRE